MCASIVDAQGQRRKERQTFSTMTPDLLRLRQWLQNLGVTHVAMESTGFLEPLFNVLEGRRCCWSMLSTMKAVPGRKTDVKLRHEVAKIAVETQLEDSTWCSATSTLPGRATGVIQWCEALGTT